MTIMHIVKNSAEFSKRVARVVKAVQEIKPKTFNLVAEKTPRLWKLWDKVDMDRTQVVISIKPDDALVASDDDRTIYYALNSKLIPIPLHGSGKLPGTPRTLRTKSRFDAAAWRFPGGV